VPALHVLAFVYARAELDATNDSDVWIGDMMFDRSNVGRMVSSATRGRDVDRRRHGFGTVSRSAIPLCVTSDFMHKRTRYEQGSLAGIVCVAGHGGFV
jgi:hypothetical protein